MAAAALRRSVPAERPAAAPAGDTPAAAEEELPGRSEPSSSNGRCAAREPAVPGWLQAAGRRALSGCPTVEFAAPRRTAVRGSEEQPRDRSVGEAPAPEQEPG